MTELFLLILNMSIAAGWTVLAVFVLRLLLRKAPKWVNVMLWGMAAVRLIFPITIESVLSLIPSAETVSPNIMIDPAPAITSGIPVINNAVNTVIKQKFTPVPGASVNPLQIWLPILAIVWVSGIAVLLGYMVVSYVRLRRRVSEAVLYQENIYQSEQVRTAFVLGIWKPRIYLPYHMSEQDMCYVIAHEQVHIRRRDYCWKPLGFLLLSVHWFNPVLWFAYILFCRDIEIACDESVIRQLGIEERANYSQALLSCSIHRRSIAACPLAFGETGIRKRVQSVLRYKKPTVRLTVVAVILCIVAAVCLLTNPTARRGVGIQVIRVVEDDRAAAVVELDYLFMRKSGFSVRTINKDEGEYIGDGMVEYDGALGEYRMLIMFGDMEPTEAFRKRYPAGETFVLENIPKAFNGNLKFKIVYPQDHGFAIYIGSDKPFHYKVPALYHVKYLGGTLRFALYNVAEPDPNLAQKRPLPGLYRPVKCIYKNPDMTDETAERLSEFKFWIGYGQFNVQMCPGMVWETDHRATTSWSDTEIGGLFEFARGTEFYDEILRSNRYTCWINDKYALIKAELEGDESFYLRYSGNDGVYAVYQVEFEGGY